MGPGTPLYRPSPPLGAWTGTVSPMVTLGILDFRDAYTKVSFPKGPEAISLKRVVETMLFGGVVVQASTGVKDMVMAAQATLAGLVTPSTCTPPHLPPPNPRAAMGARPRAPSPQLGIPRPLNGPAYSLHSVWTPFSVYHFGWVLLRTTSGEGRLSP